MSRATFIKVSSNVLTVMKERRKNQCWSQLILGNALTVIDFIISRFILTESPGKCQEIDQERQPSWRLKLHFRTDSEGSSEENSEGNHDVWGSFCNNLSINVFTLFAEADDFEKCQLQNRYDVILMTSGADTRMFSLSLNCLSLFFE